MTGGTLLTLKNNTLSVYRINEIMKLEITGISLPFKFYNINLRQKVNEHLFVDIWYDFANIGESERDFDSLLDNLGKKLTVKFTDDRGDSEFSAIIHGVKILYSKLCLQCVSVSYIMDQAPVNKVFVGKKPLEIVQEVVQKYRFEYDTSTFPGDTIEFNTIVQFQETGFQFLKKLANLLGCMLYCDGEKLYFGKDLTKSEEVVLTPETENIDSRGHLSVSLNPVQSKGAAYGYFNYKKDVFQRSNLQRVDTPDIAGNNFLDLAIDRSKTTYKDSVIEEIDYSKNDDGEYSTYLENRLAANQGKMVIVSGISKNLKLRIGTRIKYSKHPVLNESYTIIGVNITYDNHEFYNSYEAVPDKTIITPEIDMRSRGELTQIAVVVDDVDKEGLGRVKVRFPWDIEGDNTNCFWARVINPYAGKTHGSHFTPRKGDEVVVTFDKGQPFHPLVVGSLYHDNIKPSFKDSKGFGSNEVLIAKTDNGTEIHLLDQDDKQEVTISMTGGGSGEPKNSVVLTVDKGSSEPKIVINTQGNAQIAAKNDITITADNNIKIKAKNDLEIDAKKIKVSSSSDMQLLSGTNTKVQARGKMDVKSSSQLVLKSGIIRIN